MKKKIEKKYFYIIITNMGEENMKNYKAQKINYNR